MSTPTHRPIRKLLIANRSEIALRIQRGANKLGIPTVAVYSQADATALHVSQAEQAYALGGNTAAESYLDQGKILAAAKACGANAIHPGYGFLSENAQFAQAVSDAGLIWVGPPAASMHKLASKAAAKRLAKQLGIPTLPAYYGSEQSLDHLVSEAKALGAPLMLKAASGGGGRGMRLLHDLSDDTVVRESIMGAQREALAGFGDAALVIERALLAPRHVEVQVFADQWGNCIHLGERDCSVQRRHQKIIEEAPSPAVNDKLRAQLGDWATRLATAAQYVGAGTVEFLLEGSAEDAHCYLMEMNTRLQVEHPVTEAITGLDLVEWQLRVAAGEALPLTQSQVQFQGHAIEVRLCAEDDNFVPQTGTVLGVEWPALANGLRIDHALAGGMEITPYYDSMLAKLIVHAPNRTQACAQLAAALRSTVIAGLPTNRQLLAACLEDKAFLSGQALIPFLTERKQEIAANLSDRRLENLHCAAAAIAIQAQSDLPCAFERNTKFLYGQETLALRLQTRRDLSSHAAVVQVEALQSGLTQSHTLERYTSENKHTTRLVWNGIDSSLVTHAIPKKTHDETGVQRWHVHLNGADFWLEDRSLAAPQVQLDDSGPWALRAPFNGKVVKLTVAAGDRVRAGQTLLVIESMKLEHSLLAKRAGIIQTVDVLQGQQVGTGQALLQALPEET
jgi:geranyl-CoA carboxylase alpha subunit